MTMDVHPSGRALFVGRQDELRLLRARLDEVRAGEPRAVLVQGAPGIGKTALLQRFLAESTDLRVVTASGEEEEHLLPYAVVEQLVRSSRMPRTDQRAALGATTIPSAAPWPSAPGWSSSSTPSRSTARCAWSWTTRSGPTAPRWSPCSSPCAGSMPTGCSP
jgi:hypothetical protein